MKKNKIIILTYLMQNHTDILCKYIGYVKDIQMR